MGPPNNNLSTLDEYDFDKVMFISGKLPTLDIDEYEYEKNIFLNVIKYCEKNSLKLFFKEKNGFYDFKFNINSQSSHKDREIFLRIILVMRIGPSFHGIYIKTL